jgi:hypothetical protein
MIRYFLVLCAAVLLLPFAQAQTTIPTDADPTVAEVSALIAGATAGDIISIAAGTHSWTGQLNVTKSITLKGQGIGSTIIQNNNTSQVLFFVNSGTVKFIDLEFESLGLLNGGVYNFICDSDAYTIFARCRFDNLYNDNIETYGYGLVHNCEVVLRDFSRFLRVFNGSVTGASNGDGAWEMATQWGSDKFWFVEETPITKAYDYGIFDGWLGGRLVVRKCAIHNGRGGNHGTETAGRLRSMRAIELYGNTYTSDRTIRHILDIRGGTALVHSNSVTSGYTYGVTMENYRLGTQTKPWLSADGTKAWDGADLSDTYGTAGDGIFESGAAETTGQKTLTDNDKSWSTTGSGQWAGYTLRTTYAHTAIANSGVGTINVSGTPWVAGAFVNGEVTKVSTGEKGLIASNTTSQIVLDSQAFRPTLNNGDDFVISLSAMIESNTATTLTVVGGSDTSNHAWPNAYRNATNYEIRRLSWVLDGPGRGQTTAVSGSPANHQNLSQALDPVYIFNNNFDSRLSGGGGYFAGIQENRDWYKEASSFNGAVGTGSGLFANRPATCTTGVAYWATDEGEWDSTNGATPDGRLYVATATNTWTLAYTPYAYPHPLRVDASPDTTPPTVTSATVNGATLTVTFSESTTAGSAGSFAFSTGTLSSLSGTGSSRTMTLSPAASFGSPYTLSYTPGVVVDAAGNALAGFSGLSVTNSTPDPGTPSTPQPGRRRGKRVF